MRKITLNVKRYVEPTFLTCFLFHLYQWIPPSTGIGFLSFCVYIQCLLLGWVGNAVTQSNFQFEGSIWALHMRKHIFCHFFFCFLFKSIHKHIQLGFFNAKSIQCIFCCHPKINGIFIDVVEELNSPAYIVSCLVFLNIIFSFHVLVSSTSTGMAHLVTKHQKVMDFHYSIAYLHH